MTSFNKTPRGRFSRFLGPVFSLPALRGRIFWLIAIFAPCQIHAAPDPIITEFNDNEILTELPGAANGLTQRGWGPSANADHTGQGQW